MANSNKDDTGLHPDTLMMSYGYDPFLSQGAVKPPVFLTSTFAYRAAEEGAALFDSMRAKDHENEGLIYSRFNHPNLQIAEDRIAIFEKGESAAVFSSGMSAIATSILALVKPGEIILRSQPLYGGTETLITNVLSNMGIKSASLADGLNFDSMRHAAQVGMNQGVVSMLFLETPSNPTNSLIDFESITVLADQIEKTQGRRPLIVCDNTLLGPIFQTPLVHGVDLVLYSLTKYIGGHSDLVAGAAVGDRSVIDTIRTARSAYGSHLDPHSSWMIGRSLETVSIRMQRAAQTGEEIARWLATQPGVTKIHHPLLISNQNYQQTYERQCTGPGSTFSFEIKGGRNDAFAFLNRLRIFKQAVSLGGTESLVCHPRSTTHSSVSEELLDSLGVSDTLVRTSVGLEHPEDLIRDLSQALSRD